MKKKMGQVVMLPCEVYIRINVLKAIAFWGKGRFLTHPGELS
jgi:hypothetical protein